MNHPRYRGRFAPSPTGPLHFGSLVAAVASYADARHHRGEWLVRIEDVDETRCQVEAERQILRALEAFGMHWDREPVRQRQRRALYRTALQELIDRRLAYRCSCSRKLIATLARLGSEGPVYPGTCRRTPPAPEEAAAWRMIVDDALITFDDRVVGRTAQNLARDIGDFVVCRIDGFAAYQLAVVVDDQQQGITDVVRGADLLWSTPRQLWLQRQLGYATPRHAHVPLVLAADGRKLSKSKQATPLDLEHPLAALRAAWRHLGQLAPPVEVDHVAGFWQWAAGHWSIGQVPKDRNSLHERPDSL